MKRARMLMALLVIASVGCGSPAAVTSPSPSADLSGSWVFSFSALAPRACPGSAARPLGCAGEGRVTLEQSGGAVEATAAVRGSCQACGLVVDFAQQPQPLSAVVRGGRLELELGAFCRYAAAIPTGHADDLSGEVRCSLLGVAPTTGAWSMSHQE